MVEPLYIDHNTSSPPIHHHLSLIPLEKPYLRGELFLYGDDGGVTSHHTIFFFSCGVGRLPLVFRYLPSGSHMGKSGLGTSHARVFNMNKAPRASINRDCRGCGYLEHSDYDDVDSS